MMLNMLLFGRTGGSVQHHTEEETEEFSPCLAYQENLLQPGGHYGVKRLNLIMPKEEISDPTD